MPAAVLGNLRVIDNGDGTFTMVTTSAAGSAQASLTNQSALNTNGTAINGGTVRGTAYMVVTSGAGVSAGAVQLQGSLDGVNWFNLGSAVTTNAASTTFAPVIVSGTAVQYVRATITTGITGGTISANVGMLN